MQVQALVRGQITFPRFDFAGEGLVDLLLRVRLAYLFQSLGEDAQQLIDGRSVVHGADYLTERHGFHLALR